MSKNCDSYMNCSHCSGCFEKNMDIYLSGFVSSIMELDSESCVKNMLRKIFLQGHKVGYQECLEHQRDSLNGLLDDLEDNKARITCSIDGNVIFDDVVDRY